MQGNCLVLKSYIPGINSFIGRKKHYYSFSKKVFNELYNWKYKHPNVIEPPNVSDSIFVKFKVTLVNK